MSASPGAAQSSVDATLVRWLAQRMVDESRASLVDIGADIDEPVRLSRVFVDLEADAPANAKAGEPVEVLRRLCALDEVSVESPPRWLLVGGAGSGKSTLSTMFAQVLRSAWVEPHLDLLPEGKLRSTASEVCDAMWPLRTELRPVGAPRWLPLRVDLPSLAQWLASQRDEVTLDDWVSHELTSCLGLSELPREAAGSAWTHRDDVCWIFDGLDEVPATANRVAVMRLVREATQGCATPMLVTTRPQGYAGEFDDLQPLVLRPLGFETARVYAEKLTEALLGTSGASPRKEKVLSELSRPELSDLLTTPLHVAIAVHLAARSGQLPSSRWKLLDGYVQRVFERELRKNVQVGIRPDDEGVLRVVHARAGLVLHMRAAFAEGARPRLRPRELQRLIEEKLREDQTPDEDIPAGVERLLRFSADRFVLLLRESEAGYGFAVRSLQEFFAAEALLERPDRAKERVLAIALDPHWLNVLALIASRGMVATRPHEQEEARALTAGVCEAIERGERGEAAALARVGVRLALMMLAETERSAWPGLHPPLWEIVLRAVDGPLIRGVEEPTRFGPRPSLVWADTMSVARRVGTLLGRWTGIGAERWRARAREIVVNRLSLGGASRASGVELLAGLLCQAGNDAVEQLRRCGIQTAEEIRVVAHCLSQYGDPELSNSVLRMVDAYPECLNPGILLRAGIGIPWGYHDDSLWRSLEEIFFVDEIERPVAGTRWLLRFGRSLASAKSEWASLRERARSVASPAWQAWGTVATFMASPSAGALSDALEAIVRSRRLEEFRSVMGFFAWPLKAILIRCENEDELDRVVERIRLGDLGDETAWSRAEASWKANASLTPDDVFRFLRSSSEPWHLRAGEIEGLTAAVLLREVGEHHSELLDVERSLLAEMFERAFEPKSVTGRMLFFIGRYLTVGSSGFPLAWIHPVRPVNPAHPTALARCLNVVLPDLRGPDRHGWIDALDAWGTRAEVYTRSGRIDPLGRQRLEELFADLAPLVCERVGLLEVLRTILKLVPTIPLSDLRLPILPEDAPPHLIAAHAALTILRDPTAEIAPETVPLLRQHRVDLLEEVATILASRDPATSLVALQRLHELAPDDSARATVVAAMHALLRRAPTPAFATEAEWRHHAFAGDFPGRQPPLPMPVHIRSIDEVSGLRLFRESPRVLSPLPRTSPDLGQWMVILGENGVGKTTLLRAIALCLAPPAIGTRLLDERLPMVRNGGPAQLRITLDQGAFDARIEREGTPATERVVSDAAVERPWVVGYGVRRGNARGESDREPEPGVFGALHTLFERPGTLYNAQSWLLDLRRRVLEEKERLGGAGGREMHGPEQRTWDAVMVALRRVLPDVLAIETSTDHVVVRHKRFERGVRFDALSDGYLTTAGWVVDLIARWVERQRAVSEPVHDLLREMVGVVLLDEVDMHLHPVWQMRLIDDVRALFPRLSFVVTTHNPLALQGARKGEIFVMRHGDDGVIELAQHDVMPGYDVDRVLLEQFGVEQTFDRETRALLTEYRALRAKGAAEDDPRRQELEGALTERMGVTFDRLRENLRGPADAPRAFTPEEAEAYRRARASRRGSS